MSRTRRRFSVVFCFCFFFLTSPRLFFFVSSGGLGAPKGTRNKKKGTDTVFFGKEGERKKERKERKIMCAVAVNENLPANGYLSVHTPPRWARHYGDVPGSTLLLCFLFLFFHFIWLFFSVVVAVVVVVVVVVWFSSFSGDFRMKKRCSGYRTSWQCRLTWCNLMSLFTMGIAPILGHDTWWVNAENAEHVVRTALVKIRKQLMTTWKTNEKSNKTTRTRTWLGRKIARVCSMKRQPVRKNKKEKRNVFTSVRKPLLTAKFAKCRRISCRVPFAIGQKRYWPLTSSVDIEKWAQLFWKKSKKMTVNCSFDSSPLLRKARGVKWNQVIAVRFEKEPVRNWNWISIKIELTSPPNGKVDGRNRSSDFFHFFVLRPPWRAKKNLSSWFFVLTFYFEKKNVYIFGLLLHLRSFHHRLPLFFSRPSVK